VIEDLCRFALFTYQVKKKSKCRFEGSRTFSKGFAEVTEERRYSSKQIFL
jgi:hypothetical protein